MAFCTLKKPVVVDLRLSELRQNGAIESVDEKKPPAGSVPVEVVHDGRTQDTGIDTAFDEIAFSAYRGFGGPQGDVRAPLELRIDAVACLQPAGIGGAKRGPEGENDRCER